MKPDNNLVWIVSDTVRPDYLGYNGGHVRTPNLDWLAARSLVFDDHHATSFPTVPARFDYLVGEAAYVDVGWNALPPGVVTLPAKLGEAGWATAGVVDTPFFMANGFNYDRGFQYFYDMKTQPAGAPEFNLGAPEGFVEKRYSKPTNGRIFQPTRDTEADHAAPLTVQQAEACLERLAGQRFFLYVDTWDPHEPWDAPDYYVKRYYPGYQGERRMPPYGYWREQGWAEKDVALSRALYSAKLEMVDRWLGHLLEKLDATGVLQDTAIIFTSDHGFYFGEHGIVGKMLRAEPGTTRWLRSPLYTELTHVPLLISVPGCNPGRTSALTCALDIAPTVAEIAGIPQDNHQGRSLVPILEDPSTPGREVVVTALPLANPGDRIAVVDDLMRSVEEWQPITVTTPAWTLLYTIPGEDPELYDRQKDPGQQHNIAADHADIVTTLVQQLMDDLKQVGTSDHYLSPRAPSLMGP